ncbi:MAG TPA: hypothetical protein VGL82_01040 [Bryobacteraceae bacterium]
MKTSKWWYALLLAAGTFGNAAAVYGAKDPMVGGAAMSQRRTSLTTQ